MLGRVFYKLFNLLCRVRVNNNVGQIFNLLVAKAQKVIARAAVGYREARIILGSYKFVAYDFFKSFYVLGRNF